MKDTINRATIEGRANEYIEHEGYHPEHAYNVAEAELYAALRRGETLPVYCRVCGVLMEADNTIDPVEFPDECRDCVNFEMPGIFD